MTSSSLKIQILESNKSIEILPEFSLPNFTVLIGKNGSGKSHLFELLANSHKSSITYNNEKIKRIRYIAFNQLNPNIDKQSDPKSISENIKKILTNLNEVTRHLSSLGRKPSDENIIQRLGTYEKTALISVVERTNTRLADITEGLLYEYLSFDYIKNQQQSFSANFAHIFKLYHLRKIDNLLNKIYVEELGLTGNYLSNEDFLKKYGEPPWIFVDSILAKLQLPYTVTNPENTRREETFQFELRHKEHGFSIQPNDLSTGEKTLMSLALAIYNAENTIDKIDLLILDEPDAALHPSLSKLMIEILFEDICKKKEIPVIISTHAPATIACTPATSLFKITKENHLPQTCSLEDSISLLAAEIPNFRVSVENRRQVFVEGNYDVSYYEKIFNILSRVESFPTTPQFLPPHTREGANCSDVERIVSAMTAAGNDLVYGLIDSDGQKQSNGKIIVLGDGNRYAIENYLFEPHLLALYLVKKGFQTPAEIGLNYYNYIELVSALDQPLLQNLCDLISAQLSFTGSRIQSKLYNGLTIQIPEEIKLIQGHALEDRIKDTWPQLKGLRGRGDSAFKIDYIDLIVNDHPQLISEDIPSTFKKIT